MAISHMVVFTPVPTASITSNASTVPVSVLVSPRLSGSELLGDYDDWLYWTKRLLSFGLTITFECQGRTLDLALPLAQLQPKLWDATFNEETLVRPFAFNDYSHRRVLSYSYRLGMSLLKSVYLTTGILNHNLEGWARGDRQWRLESALAGLDIRWDPGKADSMREKYGETLSKLKARGQFSAPGLLKGMPPAAIPPDGAIPVALGADAKTTILASVTEPFATFYHPPIAPPLADDPTDFDTVIDFHQALTSLSAHREVQRALGLAFDIQLPADFLVEALPYGTLSIIAASIGEGWIVAPQIPHQSCAYIHSVNDAGLRVFFPAPRVTGDDGPRTLAGMLTLPPDRFGLGQIDVDGALMKSIALAETIIGKPYDRHMVPEDEEGFDDTEALATLRSSGLTLFADARAIQLLLTFKQSAAANQAAISNPPTDTNTPFFAEDLIRGYRLDIWDSVSKAWHSLHARKAAYNFADERLPRAPDEMIDEEGFVELGATTPSTNDGTRASTDLYVHEAVARWAGWSLSAPRPGKALSRYGDPEQAVPTDDPTDSNFEVNPIVTPFGVRPEYVVKPGSLPTLRFGRSYRMRARLVDLAGNGLALDSSLADFLGTFFGLPLQPEGLPYLRYQPLPAPVLVARSTDAVLLPGSAINRIVIRSFNDGQSKDDVAPDLTANDRHVSPPRASVELCEHLGMFDDASGRLDGSAAMWSLISDLDKSDFAQSPPFPLEGVEKRTVPLESKESVEVLPYLPDVLARGAAFRNLPSSGEGTRAMVTPDGFRARPVPYETIDDPNPRSGSATMVSYGGGDDWQEMLPFRLALEEGEQAPLWDATRRLLTVFLPKGSMETVFLSSYLNPEDLKLMGIWQWIRQGIEAGAMFFPGQQHLWPGSDSELVAHILQRAVEGGHWMLTPPRILKLVHAVQQPIGIPEFVALTVRRADPLPPEIPDPLITMPEEDPTDQQELALVTSWRRPGGTDAWLLGGLHVHGASTAKVDLLAQWIDPVDDVDNFGPTAKENKNVIDEVSLPSTSLVDLPASGKDFRLVGRYDVVHDTIAFLRFGDQLGSKAEGVTQAFDAAPRHQFGDTKHHLVNYIAIATSRFREYFSQTAGLDFTRTSLPVTVHVPASARPAAPHVRYVIPTFGWQREFSTNIKRSIRYGGGLRVYLDRPWYSSGANELLAVVMAPHDITGKTPNDLREEREAVITQWGQDPIWKSNRLRSSPTPGDFPDAVNNEYGLPLEEFSGATNGDAPFTADVAAFEVHYDVDRRMWYCDLTVNMPDQTYSPFIRLALARYQPYALKEVKLSRVVLADFVQLTPDRSAVVTADPYAVRTLRVTVSGVAPQGPSPSLDVKQQPSEVVQRATQITVRVEKRRADFGGDLGWEDAPRAIVAVNADWDAAWPQQPGLTHWVGRVHFAVDPDPGTFRLVIEEHEYISANHTLDNKLDSGEVVREQPRRLIYAEVFNLDHALLEGPRKPTRTDL